MPYIPREQREALEHSLRPLREYLGGGGFQIGELNYLITQLIQMWEPKNYEDLNDLIGVLECAKLEFYRRVMIPYEQSKRLKNGDVYQEAPL